MKMTNRELETRYMHMKQTWKTLVDANVNLVDENKDLKEEIERLNNIIEDFEEELEREVNIKEENTDLEHITYIDINSTLKSVLNRFRELKGVDKE